MQWWNSVTDWFGTDQGQAVIFGAIVPFVSIVVAGIVGALIGRGAVRRLVAQRDRETRAAAVASLISAGEAATNWHAQPTPTRDHFERLASASDVQVRLLPISGAALAADWAAHELNDMRKNSVSFSFQSEQTLAEYRVRLLEWVNRPGRARKLFAADLDRWKYEEPKADPVVTQQQEWAHQQFSAETHQQPERRPDVVLPPSEAYAAGTGAASSSAERQDAEQPLADPARHGA
ncbi:MAG: hypothetical protein HY996_08265 [Micrococcales bacterium]|nr:hypothetical protein [Micrococcales bacterium]